MAEKYAEGMEGEERELPEGWKQRKLLDLVSITGGKTPSTSNNQFWDGGNIPWISPKDMKAETIEDSMDHLTELAIKDARLSIIKKGSVLIVVRSGILQHTLPVSIANTEVTINQDIKALLPKHELSSKYLSFYLKCEERKILKATSKDGTTVQSVEIEKLLRFPIPLPPLPEQERIAARLDLLLGRLKTARARLDALPEILKRFRKSVLARAVSGKLTQEWRAEHAAELPTAEELLARVRAERRVVWEKAELEKLRAKGKEPKDDSWKARYKEPEPADAGELGELPDGWAWVLLEQLGENRLGKMLDVQKNHGEKRKYLGNINVRWFAFDIHDSKTIKMDDKEFIEFSLQKGDLLICEGGEPGRCAVWDNERPDYTFQKALHRFRSIQACLPKYIAIYIKVFTNKPMFLLYLSGTTIKHLTGQSIIQIPVSLPSLPEQAEIVRRVDELFAYADSLERRVEAARALAARLEPAILATAFRGELSEQIPEEAAEWERTLVALEEDAARLAAAGGAKRGRGRKMVRDPGTTAGGHAAAETPSAAAPRKRGRPRKGT